LFPATSGKQKILPPLRRRPKADKSPLPPSLNGTARDKALQMGAESPCVQYVGFQLFHMARLYIPPLSAARGDAAAARNIGTQLPYTKIRQNQQAADENPCGEIPAGQEFLSGGWDSAGSVSLGKQ
jgi:hypothetical protein